MYTFSVIVPVYNAASTIERCVKSLVKSGGDDLQIILVEDCSKDNSLEVCKKLAEKYPSVDCFHNEENRGVSYTRNRGLDAAEGKYILFADSDDWVDKEYVSAFSEVISNGGKFAVCGYVNHDEKQNGRTDVIAWNHFDNTLTVELKSEIEKLYQDCLIQQLWNKVFVASFIRENNVRFDESISIGEDTRFILDYIKKSNIQNITLINKPLYHYMRDNSGSLMFRVGYESVEEPLINLSKLYGIMGLSDVEKEQRLRYDRQKTVENYAYLIMHNMGMPTKEKKRLILALDPKQGRTLYKSNRTLFIKEQINKLMFRHR